MGGYVFCRYVFLTLCLSNLFMKNTTIITGYSTALFSTWYFVEDFGVLFDAGDGLTSHLLQKSMKAKYVFISHADRDHLTGLLQFVQLNSRQGFPKIYYPKDCGSFPALAQFSASFDPHTGGSEWIGVEAEQEIWIAKDLLIRPLTNLHVIPKEGKTKSLSYQLIRTKRKLKEEFSTIKPQEIAQLKKTMTENDLTYEVREVLVSYSGDTPVDFDGRWNGSQVLIHEATFLHKAEISETDTLKHKHSSLEEVMQMVAASDVERLILGHFSSRYSPEEIDNAIRTFSQMYQVKIPVHRVLPNYCSKDILTEPPFLL